MVELTLLKLTRPETAGDPGSLAARIEALEQRIRRIGSSVPQVGSSPVPEDSPVPEATTPPEAVVVPDEPSPRAEPEVESPRREQEAVAAAAEEQPLIEGLTSSQFEAVWPALVGAVRDELGPRRQALFREASPGGVEGSTAVLVLPEHLSFHLEQLRGDDLVKRIVESKAADLLGGAVRIEFRAGGAQDAEGQAESQPLPDKNQLLEAPDASTDPDALVEGLLGGQVVEEVGSDD